MTFRRSGELTREGGTLDPMDDTSVAYSSREPLAERMRPRTIEEFVGQPRILGPGRALKLVLDSGHLPSLIFWGPPGAGRAPWRASSPIDSATHSTSSPPWCRASAN